MYQSISHYIHFSQLQIATKFPEILELQVLEIQFYIIEIVFRNL